MDIGLGEIELEGNILLTLNQYNLEPYSENVCFGYHSELEISLVKSGSGVYMVADSMVRREYFLSLPRTL